MTLRALSTGSLILIALACYGADRISPAKLRPSSGDARPAPSDVAAPPPGALEESSGIHSLRLQAPSRSDTPAGNDCVVIRFTAWKRDGSLYSTSGPGSQTATQCLSAALPKWRSALNGMAPGEVRRVWIDALVAKDDDGKSSAPPVSLTLDLELIDILHAPPTPPDLKAPPAAAIRLPSGVRMIVVRAGTGTAHPAAASKVTVHYTKWTQDGKILETTAMAGQPAVYSVSSAPVAWRDALVAMTPGETVRLWIPSALASPDRPRGDVVCDLELVAMNQLGR